MRERTLSIVSKMNGDAQWPLAAHGTRVALHTQRWPRDLRHATPTSALVKEANLRGWGYNPDVLTSGDRAICSLGEFGLQTIRY